MASQANTGGWTRFTSWLTRHALAVSIALVVVIVALLTWAAVVAAGTTLSYIGVLRWPVAAVLLVFIFRRPLEALLDRVDEGTVPTPFGAAKFGARSGASPGETPDSDRKEPDPAGSVAPTTDGDAEPQLKLVDAQARVHELEAQVDDLLQQLWRQSALNTIFGAQLHLMQTLRAAPSGMTPAAVAELFEQVKKTYPQWQQSQVTHLLEWPVRVGLLELAQDGNYRLSALGRDFLDFADNTYFAVKGA